MNTLINVLELVVYLYMLLLLARVVISFILAFSRDWHPRGAALVVIEASLSATDPPLRVLRSVIPEINLGGLRLDLSVLILFVICSLALSVLGSL